MFGVPQTAVARRPDDGGIAGTVGQVPCHAVGIGARDQLLPGRRAIVGDKEAGRSYGVSACRGIKSSGISRIDQELIDTPGLGRVRGDRRPQTPGLGAIRAASDVETAGHTYSGAIVADLHLIGVDERGRKRRNSRQCGAAVSADQQKWRIDGDDINPSGVRWVYGKIPRVIQKVVANGLPGHATVLGA